MTVSKAIPKPLPCRPSQVPLWRNWWAGIYEKFKPLDPRPVNEWAYNCIQFNEEGNSEYFQTQGREYIIEPMNTISDWRISDLVLVFGSQTGKTSMIMGQMGWTVCNRNIRALWVLPDKDLAGDFANDRWIPMLEASETNKYISGRYAKKILTQKIGGSTVMFRGAHSSGKLSSFPCDVVICDETDKFPRNIKGEAGAVNLAEQRTKSKANPKKIKTSTPSGDYNPIWIEFLKGDQRRYYIPCPDCGKDLLLAWSPDYYTLPKTGCEAYVYWDPHAKVGGKWDLKRVKETTYVECPYCHTHIKDHQKAGMIAKGHWAPTNPNANEHFRSYHLSSLYVVNPETSWPVLATKFIEAVTSLEGPQGFINGDLAEPFLNQMSFNRTERLVSSALPLKKGEFFKIMTVDVQEKSPFFWFVVRAWDEKGNSRLVDFGHRDSYAELCEIQQKYEIPDVCVGIDSGYDPQSVYRECVLHGVLMRQPGSVKKRHFGWTPMRGHSESRFWKDEKTGLKMVYGYDLARLEHKSFELYVLGYNSDYMKDVLHRYRTQQTDEKWEITDIVTDEYWSHMNSEVKKKIVQRSFPIYRWELISSGRANHLFDCENMSTVLAKSLGFGASIKLEHGQRIGSAEKP